MSNNPHKQKIRELAGIEELGIQLNGDYSLIWPIGWVTRAFNRGLGAAFRLMFCFPRTTLTLLGIAYLAGIVIINIPMLDVSSEVSFVVATSPMGLPLMLLGAYLLPAFLLLPFFARDPGTRLGFTLIFCNLVLVPAITLVMNDTRLMLIIGDYGFALILLPLFFGFPWLYFRYREKLLQHARWSTPALMLVIALIYWEGAIGFSTTRVDPDQYTITNCKFKRPVNKNGVRGAPIWSCRVDLTLNGFEYTFPDMYLPDSYRNVGTEKKKNYLEIRHSLFDHFTLR